MRPSWAMPPWVVFTFGLIVGFALGAPVWTAAAQAVEVGTSGGALTVGADAVTIPIALLAAAWNGIPVKPVPGSVWPSRRSEG